LKSLSGLSNGKRINEGDTVGIVGALNHLHLEVENGHAYGNTQGASSDQNLIINATVSPLEAYWQWKNKNNSSGGYSGTSSNGNISGSGLNFIGIHEGLRLNLYNDPAGHATIGYGHLVHLGSINGSEPADLKDGITQAEALSLLGTDASKFVNTVKTYVKVPLQQHQFDALVSFAFNVGAGYYNDINNRDGFIGSDLLIQLNAGNYNNVPGEMKRWVNGGGVVLPGLVNRRNDEANLFTNGTYA
jgi:lysozyme